MPASLDYTSRPLDPSEPILAGSDIVWALWRDSTQPEGYGRHMVKGEDCLKATAGTGQKTRVLRTEILVCSLDHALGVQRQFDDYGNAVREG
jgi:hypothetical protein